MVHRGGKFSTPGQTRRISLNELRSIHSCLLDYSARLADLENQFRSKRDTILDSDLLPTKRTQRYINNTAQHTHMHIARTIRPAASHPLARIAHTLCHATHLITLSLQHPSKSPLQNKERKQQAEESRTDYMLATLLATLLALVLVTQKEMFENLHNPGLLTHTWRHAAPRLTIPRPIDGDSNSRQKSHTCC